MRELTLFEHDEERGVSPVIGVILMVAITVILAAVIGTFVLGLGQRVGQTAPTASIGVSDANPDWKGGNTAQEEFVVLKHNGGDDIKLSETKIIIRNATTNAQVATFDGSGWTVGAGINATAGVTAKLNGNAPLSGEFTTGDVITIAMKDDGSNTVGDGEYTVVLIDKASGRQVAQSTVEIS